MRALLLAAGLAALLPGRAGAVVCPAGQYGSASCTACAAGTYQTGTGMTASGYCFTCQPGLYCTGTGKTAGTLCPANSYCPTVTTITSCGTGLKGAAGRTAACATSYPLWGAVGSNSAVNSFTLAAVGSSVFGMLTTDVDITPDGGFIVAITTMGKQIYQISPVASLANALLAGQSSCSTLTDAANGANACFLSANALVVSVDGTFALVADSNKLRRVDLSGTYPVTTVAGSGNATWGTGVGLAANLGGLNRLCMVRDGSAVVLGSTSAGLMVMSLTSFSVSSLSSTISTNSLSFMPGTNTMLTYNSNFLDTWSYPSMTQLSSANVSVVASLCKFFGINSLVVCADSINNS